MNRMILFKRYRRLFKTRITRTIAYNTSDVQLCVPHLCNSRTSICKMKECIQSLRNIQILNYSSDANNIQLKSKERSLSESINNNKVSLRTVESIIEHLENNVSDMSESLGLKLLICCGEVMYNKPVEVRQELTNRVWNLLKENCNLTIDHYHALLQSYIDNDYRIDPVEFLKSMTVEPEYHTYCLLLKVPSSNDCVEPELLVADINKPNEKIYNSLVYAYAIRGNAEKAKGVIKLMKEENIEPSSITYIHLMYAFAKCDDMEALLESLSTHKPPTLHIMKLVKFLSLSENGTRIPDILSYSQPLIEEEHSVISVIVQLVHAGRFSDAYEVAASIPLSDKAQHIRENLALRLLEEMVKLNVNQQTVLNVINDFEHGIPNIWEKAASLTSKRTNEILAFAIFDEIKAKGKSVNCNYFWPFLKKSDQEDDVYSIIRHMVSLNVKIDSKTLKEYIFPKVDTSDPIKTVKKMVQIGVSTSGITESITTFLLNSNRLKESLSVCAYFKEKVDCQQILNALLENYKRSNDVDSCVHFLFSASHNGHKFAVAFLKKLLDYNKHDTNAVIRFLTVMKQYKAVMSPIDAKDIMNRIVFTSENEKKNILQLLSSIPATQNSESVIHPREMNLEQLYWYLRKLESKGRNTRGVLRKIFMAVCNENDTRQVNEIMEVINSNNLEWTAGMKVCLFDYYVRNEMLNEASSILSEIQSRFPHFKTDNYKIIHFATLLVKQDKIDEAFNVVKNSMVNQSPNATSSICDMLSILITKDTSNYTANMIKLLMECGYCKQYNSVLRYLVLVEILRGDVKSAADVFRACVEKYGHAPAKQQLLVEIVKSVDEVSQKLLQSVYKLIVKVNGKFKADVNLAIAYCLCNQMEKLQNLLKRSHISDIILLRQLKYLKDDEIITVTLRMLENIEHMRTINIKPLCDLTLTIYNERNDHKNALELENRMREKGIDTGKHLIKSVTQ